MAAASFQNKAAQKFEDGPRGWAARLEAPAWRRFFEALLGLGVAFFLALYATSLRESGQYMLAAAIASVSLILAALVAVRVIPYLARRTALDRWMIKLEYEFTRQGAVYLALVAVIAIAALNTGNNLLFIILAWLLAGIVASGVVSRMILAGLELEIKLPERVFRDQPAAARLQLKNRKRYFASYSLSVSLEAVPIRNGLRAGAELDRAACLRSVYIPYLPRGATVGQSIELQFARRGRYVCRGARVSTRFPFGFLRKTHTIESRQEVLVLPKVTATEELEQILPLAGSEAESRLKGRGNDLCAIRDYQPNDSTRHVDWKATARTRELKVREFTREDGRRVSLFFDRRVRDATPRTLEQFEKAVDLCACLAWRFSETQTLLRFAADGFEIAFAPAAEVIGPILEKLALIEPAPYGDDDGSNPGIEPFEEAESFQIIFTGRPRDSVRAAPGAEAYVVVYG